MLSESLSSGKCLPFRKQNITVSRKIKSALAGGGRIFRRGIDKVFRREYITRKKEVEMKKRIILAVSVLVLLALAGGGVYYYWFLPIKIRVKGETYGTLMRCMNEFHTLMRQEKYDEAMTLLKEYRSFLAEIKSPARTQACLYSFTWEHELWYVQKKYEKVKENFPEMERQLGLLRMFDLDTMDLFYAEWMVVKEKARYHYKIGKYHEALGIMDDFLAKNGGEGKWEKSAPELMKFAYRAKADYLMEIGDKEKSEQYIGKAITLCGNNKEFLYGMLLKLARLYCREKDAEKVLKYAKTAHERHESQACYCFLALGCHLKGDNGKAKEYYSLARSCKKPPFVAADVLARLKEMLSE